MDEYFNDAKNEMGIDLQEEVLPWLGPEIAVGVIDVVQSAIAGNVGGIPSVVAFLGTNDSEASLAVIEELISFQTERENVQFDRDTYRGFPLFSESDDNGHLAVIDDYILFSTDMELLVATIDRIEDTDVTGSLFESERFKKAQDAISNTRFSMLYIDAETIWKDAIRLADEEVRRLLRDQLEDRIPEWAALKTSFLDNGIKLSALTPRSVEESRTSPLQNSATAARLLPADTLAFLSFAIEPDLDPLREQLKEVKLDDLGPEAVEALTSQLDLPVTADADLSGLLDAALGLLQFSTGIAWRKTCWTGWQASSPWPCFPLTSEPFKLTLPPGHCKLQPLYCSTPRSAPKRTIPWNEFST